MPVMDSVRWLTDKQQRVWRSWLATTAQLPAALHRELQSDAGLSLPDFDVLVQLTESPEGRGRGPDLARAPTWGRRRLSPHVTPMEKRGPGGRGGCLEDGRGAFGVVPPGGRGAL